MVVVNFFEQVDQRGDLSHQSGACLELAVGVRVNAADGDDKRKEQPQKAALKGDRQLHRW
jgi:hypothetical protein